ncbi:MAG: FtsX-like permease family protein [Bacteroidetes bacterium]|nr:FtsX-like permease family protein [Bacteroidota bacterium]
MGGFKSNGINENPPKNSHLQFTMLISFKTLNAFGPRFEQAINNWNASTVKTYLLFTKKNSMNNFSSKLETFVEKNKTDVFGTKEKLFLQPLKDVHFYSANFELDSNFGARNITTIYILGIIGFFIVLSACINYSNLSIARYFNRAKEMGMRKVVGATKAQLYSQILSEAIFMTLLSVAAALVIVQLILPSLNVYLEKQLSPVTDNAFLFITILITLSLIVGILSGSLPTFFLTKVKTFSLMKMRLNPGSSISIIKKSLVVLQFVISIVMIFATVTVFNQLNYIKNKELGFNKEAMVIIDINSGDARKSFEALKSEFAKSNNVNKVSVVSRVPGDWKGLTELDVNNSGANENEKQKMFYVCADEDFLNTFDIKLKEGNNFSGNPLTDSASVIINNSAALALNISDPLGKSIEINDNRDAGSYKIIGVVNDYNFQSLHQKVSPMIIGHRKSPFDKIDYFAAKINLTNISQTIDYLKSVHEKFDHETPFEYNFLDEKIAEFYKQDEKESTIINAASFISILIACLGLFGLSAYTAQQKIKEIGIRKVLGATVSEITVVFTKDFIKLVIIAALIALPVSFYLMSEWLNGFAYRVGIGVPEILFSVLSAFVFSLLTISYQAIKAANTNPVETIRNE